MAWTYTATPGTTSDATRRDAVRLFVGDTDTLDQQLQDSEISFFLTQSSNDLYLAASIAASTLAAKYGRLVDTVLDDSNIRASYSQRQKNYSELALQMERKAAKFGTKSLGLPDAGGISVSEVSSVRLETDRVTAMFAVDELARDNVDVNPI
jgi:hypothetical protein